MARTFYDVLMLSPLADARVVTLVYRHLAKRYHPDVDPSPAAAARMAELNEAYATLSDRDRRARYDESLGLEPAHPDVWRARAPLGGPPEAAEHGSSGEARSGAGAATADTGPYGEAGPPPSTPAPSGSRLTFGRYRGWALNQVGRVDRDYLEWLSRTTMGRTYRRELDELLRHR
jgi:curved DNA-binding protein CbpA